MYFSLINMFFVLVLMLLFSVYSQNTVPKVVVWPPVSLACATFDMDIKSYNYDVNRPFTADVNVNLYDSTMNLLIQKACKLTGINGCTVYDYYISDPGTFYIKIIDTKPVSTLWTSPGFVVTQGSALSYFAFSFSNNSPSAWQDFTVTLQLTDGCGVTYVNEVLVTLSATNGISGTLFQTTSTGTVSFDVYCENPGANTIVASGLSASRNTTITILQDKISFISLDPTVNPI